NRFAATAGQFAEEKTTVLVELGEPRIGEGEDVGQEGVQANVRLEPPTKGFLILLDQRVEAADPRIDGSIECGAGDGELGAGGGDRLRGGIHLALPVHLGRVEPALEVVEQ